MYDAARSYQYKCTQATLVAALSPIFLAFALGLLLCTIVLCAWLALFVTLGLALCTGALPGRVSDRGRAPPCVSHPALLPPS